MVEAKISDSRSRQVCEKQVGMRQAATEAGMSNTPTVRLNPGTEHYTH